MITSEYLVASLGAMAFLVNIIVQLIKNIPVLREVPTTLVAIISSFIVCVMATITYCIVEGLPNNNYFVIACFVPILSTFPVAYVAMYGYDSVSDLYKRFKKGNAEDK